MKLEIAGKEHQLEFGIRFLREMDKTYTEKVDGMEFGLGMEKAGLYLTTENPLVLVDVIKAATAHDKNSPSVKEIEKAIEAHAEEHGMDKLFADIKEALGKSTWTKNKMKQFLEKAQEAK